MNRKKLNVLYCILDNRFGGPHRRSLTVASKLRLQGIETVFILGRKGQETLGMGDFEALSLKHLQCLRREAAVRNLIAYWLFFGYNVLKIRGIIRRRRIDIVHVDGSLNVIPALAAALCRKPIVWHYNDNMPALLRKVFAPLIAWLADTVIVQGRGLRERLHRESPRLCTKTTVIYPGPDTDRFAPGTVAPDTKKRVFEEFNIPAGSRLVGAIGNVNAFKGYQYFLEAARAIKDEIGTVRFLIVGSKADPACWSKLAELTDRLGLGDDVILAGFREDVPRLLASLDVFVLPSIRESCPNAVLEAMAMRVPVVATDVGAVSELVLHGRTGLVVPTRDAKALSEAVLSCLKMPQADRTAMTDAAGARIATEFSPERIAAQQRHIYETLAGSSLGHPR